MHIHLSLIRLTNRLLVYLYSQQLKSLIESIIYELFIIIPLFVNALVLYAFNFYVSTFLNLYFTFYKLYTIYWLFCIVYKIFYRYTVLLYLYVS